MSELRQRSWSWLLRNILLPIGDTAFGQRMMKRLRFLEEAQWWDADRLHAYRDRSLIALIRVAYHEVPFYRQLMDEAGVKPDDICGPGDLYKLPVVTKDMLRQGYPHQTTRPTGWKTFEDCTSGSTGANFWVRKDTETAGWCRASFTLALEWAGWQLGEPHLQTGMTLSRSLEKRLKDVILRCHYVSAFDLRDESLDISLDLLERYAIQHLWGYPGSLYFLARRALQKGWNRQLRSIVTWGDTLYPHYRQTIELAFRTPVSDTYGCNEGIQVSAQCDHGAYHIHTLDVVVEYLDDDECPVLPGQPGNLILTRLHPGPMPLIRYRVGDVGVAGNAELCDCGRGFDLMESIQGRDTDVIITPSGNRLIVHFFTGILEHFTEIDSFQVIQDTLDSMTVRVVPTRQFSEEAIDRIISALKEKGASDMDIQLELVDAIPLPPSGKRRFVISELPNPHNRGAL